jgi:hypothetical protein
MSARHVACSAFALANVPLPTFAWPAPQLNPVASHMTSPNRGAMARQHQTKSPTLLAVIRRPPLRLLQLEHVVEYEIRH